MKTLLKFAVRLVKLQRLKVLKYPVTLTTEVSSGQEQRLVKL